MNDPVVNMFLAGMVTAGFLAGGLFFARFWVRSRDSLFLAFTAAFWLLALNQALVTLVDQPEANQSWFYLLRVAAFLLIAVAIVRKNAGDAGDD
jgi:UDP-N-acetylmuramyl pentapeptide phosphotransferase/UDP-N-acetylglucosamine-1-phosphate transferase